MEFALTDDKAKDYYYWLHDTLMPDESFYTTLNFNGTICAPGSYVGNLEEKSHQYEARYKNWGHAQPKYMGGKKIKCQGLWRSDICIPGVSDMSKIMRPNNTKLFLNKVFQDFDYLTYDCLEDYQRNLTIWSTSANFTFDDSHYRNLTFVKNKRDCN
ncbi:N-acetyllactosaminide beta-1,6-N-acetylglucosaminyl-transferase-like [Tubulanus polymorphus]|uniref:N-acetyllactosaminide beta-1,6-N-acetylglucosaminyl-transferase-like n=1 Tax=Tubulanus polymorphus TaxID=672921 RepID=UPI003DA5378D